MEDGAEVQTVQRRSQWCVQVQVAGCLFPYFLGIFVTCADLKRISNVRCNCEQGKNRSGKGAGHSSKKSTVPSDRLEFLRSEAIHTVQRWAISWTPHPRLRESRLLTPSGRGARVHAT